MYFDQVPGPGSRSKYTNVQTSYAYVIDTALWHWTFRTLNMLELRSGLWDNGTGHRYCMDSKTPKEFALEEIALYEECPYILSEKATAWSRKWGAQTT